MERTSIEDLHKSLLTNWNNQNAEGMAALFADDANMVGFDGSEMAGRRQIEAELKTVFAHHMTAAYVWKIKEVRFLSPDVALLRAIVGMIPPGKNEINPATNAIQSMVATSQNGTWKISLFQNTPAQFHGRPELIEQMTKELTKLL